MSETSTTTTGQDDDSTPSTGKVAAQVAANTGRAGLRMLWRGLRNAPDDFLWWVSAGALQKHIDEAPAGTQRTQAQLLQRDVVGDRRAISAAVVLAVAGVASGAWWPVWVVTGLWLAFAVNAAANSKTNRGWAGVGALAMSAAVTGSTAYLIHARDWSVTTLRLWLGLTLAGAIMWLGRDGNVFADAPTEKPTAKALTVDRDTVRQAVATCVPGLKPDQWQQIGVLAPGLTRTGDWWDITLRMPSGITADKVRKVVGGIGVELHIDADRLVVDKGPQSTTVISGSSKPLWNTPTRTSLVTAARTSVWRHGQLLHDARGREVAIALLFTGFLVGAIPRQGKTQAARLIALYWALDPTTDIAVFDFKGMGDWAMFRRIAVSIAEGRFAKNVTALRDYLLWVTDEMTRRAEVMAALAGAGVGQGSQLTEQLAAKADLRLRPLLIAIDELQFATQSREHGEEICNLLEDIAKVGPALGIVLLLATQKPDDRSIPAAISANVGSRVALKVRTWQASVAILGSEAQGAGWDASKISAEKGVAIFLGADDESATPGFNLYRWDEASADDAWAISQRAEALRAEDGVLVGDIAEEPPPVLVEMHRVLQETDGGRLTSVDMADHLAAAGLIEDGPVQRRQEAVAAIVRPWGARTRRDRANTDRPNASTWFLDGAGGIEAAINQRAARIVTVGVSDPVSGRVSGGRPEGVHGQPEADAL